MPGFSGTALGIAGRRAAGVPPKAVSGTATSRWSATDHDAGVSLTLGGYSFFAASGSAYNARGEKAAAGKVYFEAVSNFAVSSILGISSKSFVIPGNTVANSTSDAVVYYNGKYWYGSTSYNFNQGGPVGAGSYLVGIALDSSALLMWFCIDGVWYGRNGTASSDPASGLNGIPAPASGALFPLASVSGGFAPVLNTGWSSFTYPVPAGFRAWG